MSEITQDKLWRLWELVCQSDDYDEFTLREDGCVWLGYQGEGRKSTNSIDKVLDYLDPPPEPPTYDEMLSVIVDIQNNTNVFFRLSPIDQARINGICNRHHRAKAARHNK